MPDLSHLEERQALMRIGHDFWARGWSRGTSSNYSVVVDDRSTILITASGKDKGNLGVEDFALVDSSGQSRHPNQPKSSAETLLHCWAVNNCHAKAVLHTHSVWGTILSRKFLGQSGIWLEGYEMLKGLEGVTTHQARRWLPVFENSQDMNQLQTHVQECWSAGNKELTPGFLIAGHGMYAWGDRLDTATRHMEVLEFLLECTGHSMMLR